MNQIKSILFFFLLMMVSFSSFSSNLNNDLQQVNLQLKWKHQFQFAGYYAAIEKGYYRELGLQVNLLEAKEGEDPNNSVFNGKAEFGVCTSDIVLMRSQGKPAVILATIFQHSPQILLASRASGITNIHQLIGHEIALEPNAADIIAYMADEGVSLDKCIINPHTFNVNELINGDIDAISAYSTDEPFDLDKAQFPYTIISPSMGGIDFYGDVIFSTENYIQQNPELTKKFLEASLKGWKYAMENPNEIVDLIYSKYSQRHSKEHLKFEAFHMKDLIMADVVEIGYTNLGKWQSIINVYQRLDLVDQSFTSKGLLYSDYLVKDVKLPWKLIISLLSIILIVGLIAYFFFRASQKLMQEIISRTEIEKVLHESDAKYRDLVENSPDGIVIYMDGKIVFANKESARIFGTNIPDHFLGKSVIDFVHPDDQEIVINRIKKISTERKPLPFLEERFIRVDGSVIIVEVKAIPITLNDKPAVQLIIRDIDERTQLEKIIHENEQKYRILFENSPDAYLIIIDGIFVDCNKATELMMGGEKSLFIGKSPDALSPEFQRDGKKSILAAEEKIAYALSHGTNTFDWVHLRVDGSEFIVEVSIAVMEMNGKQALFTTWRDITERKKVEEALIESEEKFRSMSDLLPQIIFETDTQGNLTYLNKQAYLLFKFDPNETVLGSPSLNFHIPEERNRVVENIKRRIANIPTEDKEYNMLRNDGSTFPALVYSNPIIKNNKPAGLRGIIVDISDRKNKEEEIKQKNEELQKLNAEKDKFFSIIAHDLKSPFNSILGFSEILVENIGKKDLKSIREYSNIIHKSSQRAMDLLMNLMEWSRSQTGRMEYNPEYFEMVELIKEVKLLLNDSAVQKSINIESHLPTKTLAFADKAMISTVLRNLISNAIKFTNLNGEINIDLKENISEINVCITDTGIGIPERTLDNLFQLGENISTPGTQNEKGTGLGLILCKEFIEKHRGKIWVESKEGEGSMFCFTIPNLIQF